VDAQVRSIVFPVSGTYSFRNDFAEPRDGGTREHLGIDIVANKMTPVVAVVDGTITFIAIPQASWGYALTIRDAEGYSYRYLHLNNDTPGTDDGQGGEANAYAAGLKRGTAVSRGQVVGWVGDSGNAEATVSHLHFEIRNPDRTTINPYESLLAASGGQASGSSPSPTHSSVGGIEAEEQFIVTRSLQEGMTDTDVVVLHQELKLLGYYSGALTETFTSVTREAVRSFQNDKGISPTGVADVATRKALAASVQLLPPTITSASSSLSLGARGEAVSILQQKLKELGFFSSDVTGYFGPITQKAVIAFQSANGIEPIGIVGPKTLAALDSAGTPSVGPSFLFTKYLQLGMQGSEVRELQLLLASQGYFEAEPTGYFGLITRAAVISFQNEKGIEPLGIVGPKTRAALNGGL